MDDNMKKMVEEHIARGKSLRRKAEDRANFIFLARAVVVLTSAGWLGVLLGIGPWRGLAFGAAGFFGLGAFVAILKS